MHTSRPPAPSRTSITVAASRGTSGAASVTPATYRRTTLRPDGGNRRRGGRQRAAIVDSCLAVGEGHRRRAAWRFRWARRCRAPCSTRTTTTARPTRRRRAGKFVTNFKKRFKTRDKTIKAETRERQVGNPGGDRAAPADPRRGRHARGAGEEGGARRCSSCARSTRPAALGRHRVRGRVRQRPDLRAHELRDGPRGDRCARSQPSKCASGDQVVKATLVDLGRGEGPRAASIVAEGQHARRCLRVARGRSRPASACSRCPGSARSAARRRRASSPTCRARASSTTLRSARRSRADRCVDSDGKVVGVSSRTFAPLGFASDGVWWAPAIRDACDKVLQMPQRLTSPDAERRQALGPRARATSPPAAGRRPSPSVAVAVVAGRGGRLRRRGAGSVVGRGLSLVATGGARS